MRSRSTRFVPGLALLFLLPGAALAKPRAAGPVIHQVTASPQGLSVNAYIVEGAHSLVIIDSALTVSDAKALRTKADAFNKPLAAILLTHGHPDHYNGVHALNEGRTQPSPVYATAAVTHVIREWDERKDKQWKPVFKGEWPAKRDFPDHVAESGGKITFDGMTFVVHALGPAESYADSWWEMVSPARAAFIGDEVLSGSHAYTNDGHTAEWIKNLDTLSKELAGVKHLYPGHGPVGDPSILAWEKAYLLKYRQEINALRGGDNKLSDEQKKTLVDRMKAGYPSEGNEFMIALGADTVAAELAGSHP